MFFFYNKLHKCRNTYHKYILLQLLSYFSNQDSLIFVWHSQSLEVKKASLLSKTYFLLSQNQKKKKKLYTKDDIKLFSDLNLIRCFNFYSHLSTCNTSPGTSLSKPSLCFWPFRAWLPFSCWPQNRLGRGFYCHFRLLL